MGDLNESAAVSAKFDVQQALLAVTNDDKLGDGAWSVAVALVLLADEHGRAMTSIRRLASVCRRDRQTVKRALGQLVQGGALEVAVESVDRYRLRVRDATFCAPIQRGTEPPSEEPGARQRPGGVVVSAQGGARQRPGGCASAPRGVRVSAQGGQRGGKGGPMSTGQDLPETRSCQVGSESGSLSSDLETSSQDLTRLIGGRLPKAETSSRDLSTYVDVKGGGSGEAVPGGTATHRERTRAKKKAPNPNQLFLPIEHLAPSNDDMTWAQDRLGWEPGKVQALTEGFKRRAREPRVTTPDDFKQRWRGYIEAVAKNEQVARESSGAVAPSNTPMQPPPVSKLDSSRKRYGSAEDARIFQNLDDLDEPYDPDKPYEPLGLIARSETG